MLNIRVLGSGAGGGFPQWNCNCRYCDGLRKGTLKASPRTQSSIALSANNEDWLLINASPDIRTQLSAFPTFQPARSLRDTAIKSILLVDSQIDHTTGLLSLRESDELNIYCTKEVHQDLIENFNVLKILQKYCSLNIHTIRPEEPFSIEKIDGILFRAIDVESKAPPYSPARETSLSGTNIGLIIENMESHQKLFYAPGLGVIHDNTLEALKVADCILVDGTFWFEDDMARAGVGTKLAQEMGHLPLNGKGGMIEVLKQMPDKRKILIHINNTNPILDEKSNERQLLKKEKIEVAYDGMEIIL